jgi:hypothetical protein
VWRGDRQQAAGPGYGGRGGSTRRFYQGLIQAAVGLFHFGNGNLRGPLKLYRTSHAYMEGLPSPYLGLDIEAFWKQMAACFAALLADPNPDRRGDALGAIRRRGYDWRRGRRLFPRIAFVDRIQR